MPLFDFLKRRNPEPKQPPAAPQSVEEAPAVTEILADIAPAEPVTPPVTETPPEPAAVPDMLKEETPAAPAEQGEPVIPDEELTAANLYPHEILLLDLAPAYYTDQQEFPKFWRTQYKVMHVFERLEQLAARGFLSVATLEETLAERTMAVLKNALRQLKLPVSGRKRELIARLLDCPDRAQLEEIFPRRTYMLSETGQAARDMAAYIPYLHHNPAEGLTIWSLHRLVSAYSERNFRELIWAHLEGVAKQHQKAEDFAALRAVRYRMYQLLMEDKRMKKAFVHLAETIYLDLSGMANGCDPLYRYISEKYFFPYKSSIVRLPVGIVAGMEQLRSGLQLSDEMLRALLVQFFRQFSVPFHLFTPEECAVIVLLELHGDKDRLTWVYELAKERFNQPPAPKDLGAGS